MLKKQINWTADFAYAVGLLTTDGCLSKDGRHLDLTSKDLEQIQNFVKILKLTNKIGLKSSGISNRKYYRVGFGDVKLYRFLLNIGLTPHKSKTLGALKIPNEYFRDFLRGHLDGDGSIITYIDNYNVYKNRTYSNLRLMTYFISASLDHLIWLQEKIFQLASVKGVIIEGTPITDDRIRAHMIKFSKRDSIKLIKAIYYKPDLVSLERKRLLANRILEEVAIEKRKAWSRIPAV